MADGSPLLEVRNLSIAFGGVRAVDGVDFDVPRHTVLSLIGPNGAGKTTVLNSISGFVRARGSIRFDGTELLRTPAHRRASLGIARTFQNLQLFEEMTLLENVITGQHARLGGNLLLDVLRFPVAARERRAREEALSLLRQLDLLPYAHRNVRGLPFGIQKLAGVARALAVQPRLLLLDEPAAGLNRQEATAFGQLVAGFPAEYGLSVLLVEHNMRLVMDISDRLIVLADGRKLAEGLPHEVRQLPAVVDAYFGRSSGSTEREVPDELSASP